VTSCLLFATPLTATSQSHGGYQHFLTGNATDVERPTTGLIVMQGGGDDVDENFVQMGRHGGGGDFVVIRASGGDEYNQYIYDLCQCDSVETLVVTSREQASDTFVVATVRKAEALWIAGGDQNNYVSFWKGTPLLDAINEHIAKPAPIGGTSAGMAVLGEFVYSSMGQSLTSAVALADPYASDVTLERDFLRIPVLRQIITDQHLQERDRMGRTVTLMARLMQDGWVRRARAIAADRETAVHIDPATGMARVYATPDHATPFVYFMRASQAPRRCEAGRPTTIHGVSVYRLEAGEGSFDLGRWQGQGGITYSLSANDGVLSSTRGSPY
jgi:cyanophycinase-like exopeptidase